jgi:leucyl aminopeptidase (aminopeptidase T)
MMLEYLENFRTLATASLGIVAGEQVLVIADDAARPRLYGRVLTDVINAMGAEATLTLIRERDVAGAEPPPPVAAAMLGAHAVVSIPEKWNVLHSNARKAATAAGVRFYNFISAPEDWVRIHVTPSDYDRIVERSERLGQALTAAQEAHVTSAAGTDLRMSLAGRTGLALHLRGRPVASTGIPGTGEATIAPVEGTAEGVAVINLSIAGREGLLQAPVRWVVKKGRVVEFLGPGREVEWLRELAARDEGASVLCQLAIGTCHTIPPMPIGTGIDRQREGRIHVAFGRNDDFGGNTFSKVHIDGLFDGTGLTLDGRAIIQNERILI